MKDNFCIECFSELGVDKKTCSNCNTVQKKGLLGYLQVIRSLNGDCKKCNTKKTYGVCINCHFIEKIKKSSESEFDLDSYKTANNKGKCSKCKKRTIKDYCVGCLLVSEIEKELNEKQAKQFKNIRKLYKFFKVLMSIYRTFLTITLCFALFIIGSLLVSIFF